MKTAPPTSAPMTTYRTRSSVCPRRRASWTNTRPAASTPSSTKKPWVPIGRVVPRRSPRVGYTPGLGAQGGQGHQPAAQAGQDEHADRQPHHEARRGLAGPANGQQGDRQRERQQEQHEDQPVRRPVGLVL